MQIGTCVYLDKMELMDHKLEILQQNGFDSCQLLAWEPSLWTEENARILKKMLPSMASGSIDPETKIPEFLSRLESAGVNDIIAEKQAQIEAWKAA